MADYMMDLWKNLTNRDVWDWWHTWNPIEPVYGKPGFLNDQPLYDYLLNVFAKFGNVSKRRAFVSAVDAESGAYVPFSLFDEKDELPTASSYKVSAVVGSASMPFIFPPRNMMAFGYNMQLMDGGSTWNNNMITAINECMKIDGITDE